MGGKTHVITRARDMAAYVQKLLGDPDYADGQDTGYCNPQPDDIIVFAGKGHAGMCPGDSRNGSGDNVLRPRRPISPGGHSCGGFDPVELGCQ
ncbi:hypothetical protein CXU21_02970 [Akkermansia muciniphila]|nr:hypothetical protein CXU21_02970 [Akkermansia muciniphila]